MPKAEEFGELNSDTLSFRKKEERTDKHYLFTHLFSLFTIAIFLLLIALDRDIPDYFIGMVGAILGYYLSKKPFE